MKILDRYILKTFIKTFLVVFTVLMLIFILQAIWVFISELAGKDLGILVVLKFLLFYSPKLVPLVLPLTILVSSIMTFGGFSEHYEFAAMKSSGISLQRAMRSLIVFIVLLGILTFFFSNNVIPAAEYKAGSMKRNIAKVQPAMAIVEGAFNDVGNINIKVEKKSGKNGQDLEKIIIHKKNPKRSGNYTVIKADYGKLDSEENSNVLSLELYDGNYYDEIHPKSFKERRKLPFVKSEFQKYVINIDLSQFNQVDIDDEDDHPFKMLNIAELKVQLDSFSNDYIKNLDRYQRSISLRTGFRRMVGENEDKISDSLTNNSKLPSDKFDLNPSKSSQKKRDDYAKILDEQSKSNLDSILSLYKDKSQKHLLSIAINTVNSITPQINAKKNLTKKRRAYLNKIEMKLHDKYALGVACIILFFVGAPLGAIIRKGGLGLPMIAAIILFLIYHFIGLFASNSAEGGKLSPFVGSWISTIIMLPLGVYLTYRATTDQGFVNLDVITVPFQKLLIKLKLKKPKDDNS
ncbi:MAG: LptF/LptG family permease [Psychroflexus sp.]|nr:LptF/LptG family permease [Psychroflexus sp.]